VCPSSLKVTSITRRRFTRLLVERETNVNTIIGDTFDEGSWRARHGASPQRRLSRSRAFRLHRAFGRRGGPSPAAQWMRSITASAASS
jgi:hypothetical protein